MGIIKDCPRSSMEKCTDKYGCQGACKAVEQFEKEWREEQEPVAYINVADRTLEWAKPTRWETPTVVKMDKVPLYTTPPKKEWVGLTDEEIRDLYAAHDATQLNYAWAIEAKLKDKNS